MLNVHLITDRYQEPMALNEIKNQKIKALIKKSNELEKSNKYSSNPWRKHRHYQQSVM